MTAAATAARQQADLLPIPCTATSGRTVVGGVVFVRCCEGREGHLQLDLPHVWSRWIETGETVTEDPTVELDF